MRQVLAWLLLQSLHALPSVVAGHMEHDLTHSSRPNNSEASTWASRGQPPCGKGSASDAISGRGLCCSIHVRTWD